MSERAAAGEMWSTRRSPLRRSPDRPIGEPAIGWRRESQAHKEEWMYESQVSDWAQRAAAPQPGAGDRGGEQIGKGLAAVAMALLEVAQAIRDAAENRR